MHMHRSVVRVGVAAKIELSPLTAIDINPLLVITRFEIACICVVVHGKMWSVVAREVLFGMAVAYTISDEQSAIGTIASMNISHYIPPGTHHTFYVSGKLTVGCTTW